MDRQIDLKALVSHIIKGDGADKCRICLGDTTEGQVYLGDTVMMDGERNVTLAELLETITGVQVELSPDLPENICRECYIAFDRTVQFLNICKQSANKWTEMINNLEEIQTSSVFKSLYVIVKENNTTIVGDTVYAPTRPLSSKEVYLNFKKRIQKLRYNEIRNERHRVRCIRGDAFKVACPKCKAYLHNEKKFNDHVKGFKLRWCRHCQKIIQLDRMTYHYLDKHNIQLYQCKYCLAPFSQEDLLEKHIKMKHAGGHCCSNCNQSFDSIVNLNSHYRMLHESQNCSRCDKKFLRYSCYKLHAKSCSGNNNRERKYICDHCSAEFKTRPRLQIHISQMHLFGWKFMCQFCGKKFPSSSQLREHDNVHNKVVDRYVCDWCGLNISTRRGYQRHTRRHLVQEGKLPPLPKPIRKKSNKKFPCDVCAKIYAKKKHLVEHFKKHHLEFCDSD